MAAALAVAAEREAFRPTTAELVIDLRDPSTATRARTLLVWLGADSVDTLIDTLDDDQAQRGRRRWRLASIRDSRAVEPLCDLLLSGGDSAAREAAAWALGEIRDPAAVGRPSGAHRRRRLCGPGGSECRLRQARQRQHRGEV